MSSLSIRWRLAAGIVLAFIVTMAAIFVTVHFSLQRILADDLDNDLARDIDRVQAQAALAGSAKDPDRLREIIQRNALGAEPDSPLVTVIRDTQGKGLLDSTGRPVATSGIPVDALDLSGDALARVLAGGTVSRTVELFSGRDFRLRSERLVVAGQPVAVVQVAQVNEPAVQPLAHLQTILFAEGIGAAVFTLALAFWLSRGAVKPLQKVIDVAAEIEASDLHLRIAAHDQPAEVQKLADTFDAMLARLDKAFEEQKIFLLDISHELRTPLTALRGNIDVMLMDDSLAPEVREHLERISSEVARLIRLTANLLYVASADVGREPERRPVELDVLCLEVYRQARDLRDDVKLTLGGEDQVIVMGDRDLLKQMVLNLVDNGLKYARSGGHVSLNLARDGDTARIVVADDGPGIAPEALPHIFERFYRGEDRRRKGGTGLGLAIADWVARSHGGRIDVESELGHGSKFTVALPIAQEEPAEGGGKEPARAPEEQPASGGRRVDPELRGLPEG